MFSILKTVLYKLLRGLLSNTKPLLVGLGMVVVLWLSYASVGSYMDTRDTLHATQMEVREKNREVEFLLRQLEEQERMYKEREEWILQLRQLTSKLDEQAQRYTDTLKGVADERDGSDVLSTDVSRVLKSFGEDTDG